MDYGKTANTSIDIQMNIHPTRQHIVAERRCNICQGYMIRFNNDPSQPMNDLIRYQQMLLTNITLPMEQLYERHEKYGLSKAQEA